MCPLTMWVYIIKFIQDHCLGHAGHGGITAALRKGKREQCNKRIEQGKFCEKRSLTDSVEPERL